MSLTFLILNQMTITIDTQKKAVKLLTAAIKTTPIDIL